MFGSEPRGGMTVSVHGPDYRADRFALLTGDHRCYQCKAVTRVSAIGLAGYQERDREYGDYSHVDDAVLLTGITALNGQAAAEVARLAPGMRIAHSKTAGVSYLANHCQHCSAMIGAWFIKKPGEAFFPASLEDAKKLSVMWIDQPIEAEDEGGSSAVWLDQLLMDGVRE